MDRVNCRHDLAVIAARQTLSWLLVLASLRETKTRNRTGQTEMDGQT